MGLVLRVSRSGSGRGGLMARLRPPAALVLGDLAHLGAMTGAERVVAPAVANALRSHFHGPVALVGESNDCDAGSEKGGG